MLEVTMRKVEGWMEVQNMAYNKGGEYVFMGRELFIVCPRCKRPCSMLGKFVKLDEPLTLEGGFLCKHLRGSSTCGFHASIANGIMTEVPK